MYCFVIRTCIFGGRKWNLWNMQAFLFKMIISDVMADTACSHLNNEPCLFKIWLIYSTDACKSDSD